MANASKIIQTRFDSKNYGRRGDLKLSDSTLCIMGPFLKNALNGCISAPLIFSMAAFNAGDPLPSLRCMLNWSEQKSIEQVWRGRDPD
jgi:hypothetical protein